MSERVEQTDAERLAAAEAALAELREERARLWEEVHRLRAERREVEYYERLATQMQSSVSWRITAPLRAGKVLNAKVRRKLEERERRKLEERGP